MTNGGKSLSLTKLLAGYGIRPQKGLGQHFLVDTKHLSKLLQANELRAVDVVLEIGPGPGNLTELLVGLPVRVIAAEIDQRFVHLLEDRFGDRSNFELCRADILERGKLNPRVVTKVVPSSRSRWAVVSNLPYQVAGTVILESLYLPAPPRVMIVTIQKEVAERLRGRSGTKDFSALSVLTQARAEIELISRVPAGAFWPAPQVSSAIVKITPRGDDNVICHKHFRELVNRLFMHRRKTLRAGYLNTLSGRERTLATEAFTAVGIDPSARAEQLAVEDFIGLSNFMVERETSIAGRPTKQ